ncbi:MAG: glycosyltransferase, partial [Thermoplasmata archaeon]
SFPTSDDVVIGMRHFRLASTIDATLWLLDYALEATRGATDAEMAFQVVSNGVIVDVDHTARHDLHTGIQQVVRQVLPLWVRDHDIIPVVWTDSTRAMRTLTPTELDRVFQREQERSTKERDVEQPLLVVPWHSVVVLAEVPSPAACDRLTALARFSDNDVVAIGYDCIPALSPDMMPEGETNRFAHYLPVIKHARRVTSIGATATSEFRGFARALSVQGLTGPLVSEVKLPVGKAMPAGNGSQAPAPRTRPLPLVLCVGTFEPRKNQLGVLYAAERLWREGLTFELLLVGGAGWGESVPSTVSRLQRRARPVRTVEKATGVELHNAYSRARFTVFPSLHEGFGLPVAESLEHGTPVITTNYGSTQEIARDGGAILIDPHDDEELVVAMRRLLTDDELVAQLRRDILARPVRTWQDYASEAWDNLVVPSLGSPEPDEDRRS